MTSPTRQRKRTRKTPRFLGFSVFRAREYRGKSAREFRFISNAVDSALATTRLSREHRVVAGMATMTKIDLSTNIEAAKGTAWREHNHHQLVRKTSQRYGLTFIGQEFNFICWLDRAERVVNQLATSDSQTWEAVSNGRGGTRFRLTKLGSALFGISRDFNPEIATFYEHHRFNPPLTVAFKVVKRWSEELRDYINGEGQPQLGHARVREILELMLHLIRSECRSQGYRDELDNYRRNEEKNVSSCCEYMAAQFERRSVLLINRIDLYFRPLFWGWGYTREADAFYSRFLRALRENRIVPDVLGYISKREAGVDRGVHFHLLCIQDGHLHRDSLNMTRLIGEEWVRRCGHGDYSDGVDFGDEGKKDKASYFNCYTRADQYRYNGLGLVRPMDADKLRGIRLAIEYMCKETSQLKPSPPKALERHEDGDAVARKGVRNLRKGIMPKGHSGRGAPRSSGLDTSAISRELLKR